MKNSTLQKFTFMTLAALAAFFPTLNLSASESPSLCQSFFHKKYSPAVSSFLLPGPLPEVFHPETLVLSAFFSSPSILPMHAEILRHLPLEKRALVLIPGTQSHSVPVFVNSESYRQFLKESGVPPSTLERIEILEIPVGTDFDSMKHGNWTRDFISPLAITKEGKLAFINTRYVRKSADKTDEIYQNFLIEKAKKEWNLEIQKVNLPVYFEWGNFESDGQGRIFVSRRVLKNNRKWTKGFSSRELLKTLGDFFGDQQKIVFMEDLPGEPTGHVDMFMKFLSPKIVLVASTEHRFWKDKLNRNAKKLEDLGYEVLRLEMAVDLKEMSEFPRAFRSYTNSIVIGQTAFVPRFDHDGVSLSKKDREAVKIYRALGYKVISVDSAAAIYEQGSLHCLSSLIPSLKDLSRILPRN